MTALGSWLSRFIPPRVWAILGILKNALNQASQATGAFDVQDGPTSLGTGNFKPQGFLDGPKGAIVEHEVIGILAKVQDQAKVQEGMSHAQSAFMTTFLALLVGVLQGLDWSQLFSHPKQFGIAIISGLCFAWGNYLNAAGRTVVDLGSNHEVKQLAKTYDSVKVEAALPEPKV